MTHSTTRRALAALLLSLLMVLAFMPIPAQAVTSEEKYAEAQAVMNQLDEIQTQINEVQWQYYTAVEAHEAAIAAMNEAQARMDAAQERIEKCKSRLSSRAVAIYRNGTIDMLDVLLESNSFSDFVTLSGAVNAMNQRDAELVAESKAIRAEAEAAKAEYEAQKIEAEQQMQAAADAEVVLQQKAGEMQAQINQLTEEAAELQAQEEAAAEEARKAAEAAAAAEAARAAAAANSSSSSSYYTPTGDVVTGTGTFTHPCPGYNYISSTFGYRSFDNSFHKGTDFAAAAGTPIYAADAGTVVIARYSSSAGNWVVISHGNGLVTKYMHMQTTPFVVAGQTVQRGQNIGVVGNTGYSTGPHLHFQVEVNGAAVNPMYYL